MNIKKKFAWSLALAIFLWPLFSGCGVFDRPRVDSDGHYVKHFYCCGPIAIRKALTEYNKREGILNKRYISSKEISKQIQEDGMMFKRFLSLLDKEFVCSTWSWEMKNAVKKYGFELVSVNNFKKLDPSKDIAFVLVRGKFLSKDWHWMCYPVDKGVETYFGTDTKIDLIYLLKKID